MDGDFNCARWRGPRGLLNQRVCRVILTSSDVYLPRLLDYALPGYLKAINDLTSSVTVKHLSSKSIAEIPLPLPPMDQQKHIVAEIEKQFSRLDEAVANLKRVKANLKRYKAAVLKAAVLKAAVEGRLVETEAELARKEGRSYETGEQLLQRILETRRSQWKGKGKHKEPAAPDTTDLPELPEGWVWGTVDQLLMSLRNGLSKKPEDSEPGIPILRISSVRLLELDTKDSRFYRPQAKEHVDEYKLEEGDVLFVRYNGTKELVGVCALVTAVSGALLYPDKLIRARVVSEQQVLPSYLAITANVGKSRQHIDELIKTTAGQQGIAGGEIKQMPIPLPPFAEQQRIVAEAERRLSLMHETEAQVDANLKRAERLRQSMLTQAFCGHLMKGDPMLVQAAVKVAS
jgi:type I restriction enzyme S subunit